MIITKEEYKKINGITGTDKDAVIDALIPLVEEEYMRIRNAPLEEEGVYPPGAKFVAADMISYRLAKAGKEGISSETIGDYSVSYEASPDKEYPQSILRRIRRHARVR